ncbi:nitric oxide synthase oxygenase (plasmid) [Micromonospora zamorensis]|uniref:nitric oxide synthase oxygenase n=1 Tax=Micromonospora zamorensis TaxID=709883 RepID=UPI002E25108D
MNAAPTAAEPGHRAHASARTQPTCPIAHDAAPTVTTATPDILGEAHEFLEMFSAETNSPMSTRWAQVRAEIAAAGTWAQTPQELTFGARVAWRQSIRCVGRLRWPSLVVRDRRHTTTTAGVVQELAAHLRFATNRGRIRSTITVFAPDTPAGPTAKIHNDQLVRYAGYQQSDGHILGDPRQVPFTDRVRELGWKPPRTPSRFDILPWLVQTATEPPTLHEVPAAEVLEVPLRHPHHPWFQDLNLRWHAVPVISNMRLRIGGVDYSAAPFSGFYVAAEIATRNLADADRYNQLPVIGHLLGLVPDSDPYWRDKALLVLNEAVSASFAAHEITISDHHRESRNHAIFAAREEAAGRPAYGDWSWINGLGPMTPQDPSWSRYYAAGEPNPNFWLDSEAAAASCGERPTSLLNPRYGPAVETR